MNSTTTTTVLSTPAQINALRAHTLRIGLESEIKHKMRLTSKARSCYSIIKSELGFRGNKVRVYAQYILWMEKQGLLTMSDSDRATLTAWAVK
jgi:hypothetical protein